MHYFKFEIKEWISNTAHLSLQEESAYLRLIFYYYDSEKPIENKDIEKIFRKCRIPNELGFSILSEFFQCIDDSYWIHKRCDEEISRYHEKIAKASMAGKLSAQRFNGRSTDVQPIINHESLIINHKQNKKPNATNVACPSGIPEDLWSDFLILRRSKRLPITKTALSGLEREANKAGIPLKAVVQLCCERGWGSFKATWLDSNMPNGKSISTPQLAAARTIFGDERGLKSEVMYDAKKIT